jgi:hypothetical protein
MLIALALALDAGVGAFFLLQLDEKKITAKKKGK